MGRNSRKALSRKTESPAKTNPETTGDEPPPVDYSHLRPVPKNRALLIASAVLLGLWFVALIALVFISRS